MSKMELFANIVDCFQPLTIFAKHSILAVQCHLFHKKLGLQSLQITSTFKFNFIFTLSPYDKTLLISNSIHVSFISNRFTHAVE